MNMDGMEPSSAQYNQETLETMLVCTKPQQDPKKPRPQPENSLKCPRCDSTNTKFCYYNNYNLNQPRYFCKSCKRYWTKGGTLRNVPVGGGCRRNKRSSSSSKLRNGQDQSLSSNPSPISGLGYDSSDLSLAFSRLQDGHDLSVMGNSGSALNGLFGNFVETPSGFQNLYYGNGFGNMESGFENGGIGINHGIMGYEQEYNRKSVTNLTSAGIKQEYCSGREGEQRVLLGFPWQIGGNENIGGDFENSGRGSWNGIGATWHGLLNSSLV